MTTVKQKRKKKYSSVRPIIGILPVLLSCLLILSAFPSYALMEFEHASVDFYYYDTEANAVGEKITDKADIPLGVPVYYDISLHKEYVITKIHSQNGIFDQFLLVGEGEDLSFDITVSLAGDVTDDGILNARDLARLMRYISKDHSRKINKVAANIHQESDINARDLTRLMKIISGEDIKADNFYEKYSGIDMEHTCYITPARNESNTPYTKVINSTSELLEYLEWTSRLYDTEITTVPKNTKQWEEYDRFEFCSDCITAQYDEQFFKENTLVVYGEYQNDPIDLQNGKRTIYGCELDGNTLTIRFKTLTNTHSEALQPVGVPIVAHRFISIDKTDISAENIITEEFVIDTESLNSDFTKPETTPETTSKPETDQSYDPIVLPEIKF